MEFTKEIADIAALIGSETRAKILVALSEGRPLTAGELAIRANVSAQTASNHLGKLLHMKLISCETYTRHRYYAIASPLVANALEALSLLAPVELKSLPVDNKLDKDICFARSCYDHIAGTLGVKITAALINKRYLRKIPDTFVITKSGKQFFLKLHINCDELIRQKRSFIKLCLDWTERKHHLAGSLGAAMLDKLLEHRVLIRAKKGRALHLTAQGKRELTKFFDIEL